MRRITSAVVAASVLATTACATAPQTVSIHPTLAVGAMAERTDFERQRVADASPGARKVTPALFWTGVVLAALGVVGTVGFGAGGYVVNNELDESYDKGIDRTEQRDLVDRGKLYNNLAITSAAIGLLGAAAAAVVYGYDYTHCGPLARKKRRCDQR